MGLGCLGPGCVLWLFAGRGGVTAGVGALVAGATGATEGAVVVGATGCR